MSTSPRRIAVVGAGISGLGAAWLLSRGHDVVLFEASGRPGGHARTLVVHTRGREVPVDTGFIVFNRVNYPHLCRLFEHLDVPVRKSRMSFAVSVQGIPDDTPLFATLNPRIPIDESLILDEHRFDHPRFDSEAFAAQARLPSIQGRSGVWYCGAWTGMGFHEDGLASAVRVVRRLGVSPPWE